MAQAIFDAKQGFGHTIERRRGGRQISFHCCD
jgi:hypothetical protein